jgi:pimeloyl-ACP methyl ester carboxylesterase
MATSIRGGEAVRKLIHRTLIGIVVASLSPLSPAAEQTDTPPPPPSIAVEEGLVTLADSKIQYFSRGKGETVVLLPGWTLTVGYLDGLADAIARAGYRVVGINFRGSGKSTGSGEGVTLETNADDVAGVVDALDLGPVHVVGTDFGGRVARVFAASRPKQTRSVILLGAGGKVPPEPEAAHALQVIFDPKSTDAEVLAVLSYLVSDPGAYERVWAIVKPCRDPEAASIEKAAADATPLERWWAPHDRTKVLILQGADDKIVPPENGVELKKKLGARATLVSVPGAAHLLPVEQPEIAAASVLTFIRQLDGKR